MVFAGDEVEGLELRAPRPFSRSLCFGDVSGDGDLTAAQNNVQPGDVWEQTHRGGSASDAEMRRLSYVRMRMQLL